MKQLILVMAILTLIACGKKEYIYVENPTCYLTSQSPAGGMGNQLVCPEREDLVGEPGKDGSDGQDGQDGADGQNAVLTVIDPCGPHNKADEVLLVLSDGSVLAWYQGLGLYVIEDGKNYQTTDDQVCAFNVTSGIYTDATQTIDLEDL